MGLSLLFLFSILYSLFLFSILLSFFFLGEGSA